MGPQTLVFILNKGRDFKSMYVCHFSKVTKRKMPWNIFFHLLLYSSFIVKYMSLQHEQTKCPSIHVSDTALLIGGLLSYFWRYKGCIYSALCVRADCSCVCVFIYTGVLVCLWGYVLRMRETWDKSLLEACSDCLQLVWSRRDEGKNWI